MKPYVSHYELQTKCRGGDWVHIGNIEPKYEWSDSRTILNETEARQQALAAIVCHLLDQPKTTARTLIVVWMRNNPDESPYMCHVMEL